MRIVKNDKGFTMVELIVTLVIIALLAGITIPSFTGYIDKANEQTCETYRVKLTEMFNEYCDWEGYPKTADKFPVFLQENGLENIMKCPSGGGYSYKVSSGEVECSKHNNP